MSCDSSLERTVDIKSHSKGAEVIASLRRQKALPVGGRLTEAYPELLQAHYYQPDHHAHPAKPNFDARVLHRELRKVWGRPCCPQMT